MKFTLFALALLAGCGAFDDPSKHPDYTYRFCTHWHVFAGENGMQGECDQWELLTQAQWDARRKAEQNSTTQP